MNNTKILEMINNGQIEELKVLVKEEIYKDSMKGNGDAKKRYTAMKRYFKYADVYDKKLSMPCKEIVLDDAVYNCFIDGFSLVLTTEDIGEITPFDNSEGNYLDVKKLINYPSDMELLDVNEILAKAKSKGYKFKKSEIGQDASFQYAFRYREGYFKIGILDQVFSIINDGEKAEVYYTGSKSMLYFKTSIGMCAMLPFNPNNADETKTIINVEELKAA